MLRHICERHPAREDGPARRADAPTPAQGAGASAREASRRRLLLGAAAAGWTLAGGARHAGAGASAGPLVFAAASMTEALVAAGRDFAAATGTAVPRFAFAGSSALARQIEAGAPAGLFVAADPLWMDRVQHAGLLVPDSRRTIAGNALVVVVPTGARAEDPAAALAAATLLRPGMPPPPPLDAGSTGRIAVALVDAVPAGRYARAALTHHGWWPALAPRLVQTGDVRAALAFAARGEVDAAVVYATDALAEPRVRTLARFAPTAHPAIAYPAALIAPADPAARAFLAFLEAPPGQRVLARHGFLPGPAA
ncbi:MAG: molybdate ABC transporter substrate-binding protein [Pseudomonadota bacterium]